MRASLHGIIALVSLGLQFIYAADTHSSEIECSKCIHELSVSQNKAKDLSLKLRQRDMLITTMLSNIDSNQGQEAHQRDRFAAIAEQMHVTNGNRGGGLRDEHIRRLLSPQGPRGNKIRTVHAAPEELGENTHGNDVTGSSIKTLRQQCLQVVDGIELQENNAVENEAARKIGKRPDQSMVKSMVKSNKETADSTTDLACSNVLPSAENSSVAIQFGTSAFKAALGKLSPGTVMTSEAIY